MDLQQFRVLVLMAEIFNNCCRDMRLYVSITIAVFVLIGSIFLWKSGFSLLPRATDQTKIKSSNGVPDAPRLKPARMPLPGYQEYRNEFYKFQVFYPDILSVKEFKEKGSAITLTFENADRSQGFQVFITPFGGNTITETRIKTDNPSGVVEQMAEATIDGQKGITFFGKNEVMGETREVWFIARGFLYEVNTYKSLDSWLRNIMQSWQFL